VVITCLACWFNEPAHDAQGGTTPIGSWLDLAPSKAGFSEAHNTVIMDAS